VLRNFSGISEFPSGKIVEGRSVMCGTRLQPMAFSTKLGCFTEHSSALIDVPRKWYG